MNRSLRIALVVNPFALHPKGGDHASELSRELLGLGHAVRGFGARPGWIPRSGSAHELEARLGLAEGSGLLGFRPHVIVAYDALSPAAWLAARRARRLRVPLVLVEEALPDSPHAVERSLRRLGENLWGLFVRRTATRLVALDGVAHAQAIQRGFSPEILVDIDPGVSLSTFRPGLASHLLSQHDIRGRILLHVGPVSAGRGLDLILRAFAATVGQRSDWSLVFAGEGPGRSELRAMADRFGVGSRVHWVPSVRDEELPGLLGVSTLFAMPSPNAGPEGRLVRQAMAAGLPVLAHACYQPLVESDVTGLVAEKGDVPSWTEVLRRAASSPEGRRRWGETARRRAEEKLSWPAVALDFERLFHSARAALASKLAAKGMELGELAEQGLDDGHSGQAPQPK